MTALLLAAGLLLLGAALALGGARSPRWASRFGLFGTLAGCAVGFIGALPITLGHSAKSFQRVWAVPYGSFSLGADGLSALFLLVLFGVSAAAAVYGMGSLDQRKRNTIAAAWFFFNLLVASMLLVVLARNGVLFLVAWEVMAIASFFLVTLDDTSEKVRGAGRTYLIATHLGTAALLAMFALLGREAGSLDFERIETMGAIAPALAGLLFLLGLIGFGTKAGLVPLHVWLPEAHPAAPSHVSALLSGAMIALGAYGILRLLSFLGPPPMWWGSVLIAVGLLSALFGALSAAAQGDLKRLLAYSSIEHLGIISVGVGVGLVGRASGSAEVALLGFGGALLHVVNHALAKTLLFLGAGVVAHETGTRILDRLGGLLPRMPRTGGAVFVGAVALAGLPPLNGFAGELLIYLGALRCLTGSDPAASPIGMAVLAGLAITGGMAAIGGAKVFGIAFLGQPRSPEVARAREPSLLMGGPLVLLAVLCLLAGPGAFAVARLLVPALAVSVGPGSDEGLAAMMAPLRAVAVVMVTVLVLVGALAALRRSVLRGRTQAIGMTWDCGYAAPTSRMQYTASSFSWSLVHLFSFALGTKRNVDHPSGHFPIAARLGTQTLDRVRETVLGPALATIARGISGVRWIQHGHLNLYVLYIALTLLVLLVWKLR